MNLPRKQSPSQYYRLPSDTLQERALNAIFNNSGREYSRLTTAVKQMYNGPIYLHKKKKKRYKMNIYFSRIIVWNQARHMFGRESFSLQKVIQVQYRNESCVDEGGLKRDFFFIIMAQLLASNLLTQYTDNVGYSPSANVLALQQGQYTTIGILIQCERTGTATRPVHNDWDTHPVQTYWHCNKDSTQRSAAWWRRCCSKERACHPSSATCLYSTACTDASYSRYLWQAKTCRQYWMGEERRHSSPSWHLLA